MSRLRQSVRNFFVRPSLLRDAALTALAALILGTATLLVAADQLNRLSALAEVINASGRLRLLSQQIAYTAHRAADGESDAKLQLPLLEKEFGDGLLGIEARGRSLGLFVDSDDDSPRAWLKLQEQWSRYQEMTQGLVATASSGANSTAGFFALETESGALIQLADAVVKTELSLFSKKKTQVESLIPVVLIGGILLTLLTIAYNYVLIRKPLEKIGRLFDRITAGDFTARVLVARKDEFGVLSEHINDNIQTIETLRAEQIQSEKIIRESELRNRTLWEVSTDAIVMIDACNRIRFANPAVGQVFGYAPNELVGRDIAVVQPERFRGPHRHGFAAYNETGNRRLDWTRLELLVLHKTGREVPVELSFAQMALNEERWFVGFFRDATQRLAALEELRIRERAITSTGEGVMITDAQAGNYQIVYINPALERITGYTSDDVIGKGAGIILGADTDQIGVDSVRLLVHERREGMVELKGHRKDGTPYWAELSVAPVYNAKSEVSHYVSVYKDITERKRQEEALLHSATYDQLTRLPNRSLLQDRFQQAISSAERHKREIGVLFVDLDHFKTINDSLGHHFGDGLLTTVAGQLQSCLREGDSVARWGGDEFVVLLPELVTLSDIRTVADRILECFNKPVFIDGHEIYCTASIGSSFYPKDGSTPDELLKHADAAMYRAKEQGRNTHHPYSRSMQAGIDRRFALENELRKAIQNGELLLHFQPKIDLRSHRVMGAEALVRWQHPEYGLVSPAMFIPVAEETGLILAIDQWVMDEACAEVRRWRQQGISGISAAINLSARQFAQADLTERLAAVVARHGLRPADIEIEITESTAMRNSAQAIDVFRNLRTHGFHVAIDDFGTGYSSLAYLKSFPIETLKIDRSFVQDKNIVRAIIQLAVSYNLRTVAEGVEDRETLDMLAAMGCDVIQGYFYSKPLPATEFVEYARNFPARGLGIVHLSEELA